MMREAGIAAESLYSGLTALRKANYAQVSLYNHAFFGITIGLERMAKLAILIESRTVSGGVYPTDDELRRAYGHDLNKLFAKVDSIREDYVDKLNWSLPNEAVSRSALSILADFARWTRYYNMDVLVGAKNVRMRRDPVEAWFTEIGGWVLRDKYSKVRAKNDETFARFAEAAIGKESFMLHIAEDGSQISSVYDATLRSRQMDIIQREGAVICACLARHIADVMFELVWKTRSMGVTDIPDVAEFFTMLYNDESYLRSRKTFSILR